MADLDFTFNANEIEDRQDFSPLPVGDYIGEVTESDYLPTKKGTGKYIKLVFTILDGPYAGRKFFDNLNVINENKVAMDIANQSLKELLVATGLSNKPFTKTLTLHNIPVKMKISIGKRKDTGEEQNSVRYKPLNEIAPRLAVVPSSSPAAQAEGPKKKPWEK